MAVPDGEHGENRIRMRFIGPASPIERMTGEPSFTQASR